MVFRMDIQKIAIDIEARAKRLQIPMYQLCRDAGVNVNIVSKWKRGKQDARLSTINRLTFYIETLEAKAFEP